MLFLNSSTDFKLFININIIVYLEIILYILILTFSANDIRYNDINTDT